MALDKQGILNELGSVMSKLQSADCGCMGKLFSNQNGDGGNMANTASSGGCGCGGCGCRRGCCHGGFNFNHGHGEPGVGGCNPKKMYADTYNYLNTNLMQPTVNEVYNDLKSITPENTVMNNSMAATMGLAQGNMQEANSMQGMQGGNPMQGMNGSSPVHGNNGMQGMNSMQGGNGNYGGNNTQTVFPTEGENMQNLNYMQGGSATYRGKAMSGGYSMEGNIGAGNHTQQNQMSSPMFNQMQGDFRNELPNERAQQMMGGVGPNILNMMNSGGNGKPSSPKSGQMPGQMLIDAPQSPHGKVGVTPVCATGGMYNAEGGMLSPHQQLHNPVTQYVTGADKTTFNPSEQNFNALKMQQRMGNSGTRHCMRNPNVHQEMGNHNMQQGMTNPNMQQQMSDPNSQQNMGNSNMQQNIMNANMQQRMANSNPGQIGNFNLGNQRITSPNHNYGQHSEGMKKFNEMFPGVMGGDLGFDPMTIALQMNPENHKRVAMGQMNNIMSGNKQYKGNGLAGVNAAAVNFVKENVAPNSQQNIPPNQQPQHGQSGSSPAPILQNQYAIDMSSPNASTHPNQQQVFYEINNTLPQPANTGASATNQEHILQQQYQYQQQQMANLHGSAPVHQMSPVNQGAAGDINVQQQEQVKVPDPILETQLLIQDPIYPSDNNSKHFIPPLNMRRQKFYQVNTLGQPVQMIPAKTFHSAPETNLPRPLYPQSSSGKLQKNMSGNSVKATESKTSLMGIKPVGKSPSRSQLQNIYHQYKGSQSYTQQNVRNPVGRSDTHSAGKLGVQNTTHHARSMTVERVGGDTAANNHMNNNLSSVKEVPIENHGDVPADNKPHGDVMPTKDIPKTQGNVGKLRNGLQDLVFTATPKFWTFHGNGGMPFSAGYRGHRGRA